MLVAPSLLAARNTYASIDVSGDRKAAAWTDQVLGLLEPNAMVVSWWSYSTPLWYAQIVEGRRPDILIVDDRTRLDQGLGSLTDVIDANLGRPARLRDPAGPAGTWPSCWPGTRSTSSPRRRTVC